MVRVESLFTWSRFYSTDIEHVDTIISAVTDDVRSRGVQNKSGITCNTSKKNIQLIVVIYIFQVNMILSIVRN